uniref:uncharacterized protein LOC105350871 n=1 Tax=Fragaria vesca subsp. vesca TaxID=101020 RepID=UPI0005CB114E|nr:PREDICTED: uncharacterized protein LOC105350871 [Fragaria vesca subsp. vesca]
MAEKIKPIGDADFRDLAQETLACFIDLILDCNESQPSQFRRLSEVVPNLGLVLRNKEEAKRQMEWFMKEVCEKAFGDIIHRYLNGLQEFHSCPPPVVPSLAPKIANTQSSPAKQGITDDEARRSLFVTFSKGHPVSKGELETLIRQQWDRNFEDRVEKIIMDEHYMLSARVLCKSPADVRRIVGDEEGRKVHYSINAKDVRVRKWVRRTGALKWEEMLQSSRCLIHRSQPH